jgi:hypothetical protein
VFVGETKGRSVLVVTHQVPYKMFRALFQHLDGLHFSFAFLLNLLTVFFFFTTEKGVLQLGPCISSLSLVLRFPLLTWFVLQQNNEQTASPTAVRQHNNNNSFFFSFFFFFDADFAHFIGIQEYVIDRLKSPEGRMKLKTWNHVAYQKSEAPRNEPLPRVTRQKSFLKKANG